MCKSARRGRPIGLVTLVLVLGTAAPAAHACSTRVVSWTATTATPSSSGAGAIPGATYTGVADDGATIGFTVSSDGTRVDSYRIGNSQGDTCTFYAAGDSGVWEGAPINGGAFEYHLYDSFFLRGSFTGAQSAAGTFQFRNSSAGGAPGSQTGGGAAGGGNGQGNGASPRGRPKFATRVVLRRLSVQRLGGHISSSARACRSGRTLILWRGSRQIARTRVGAGGRYSFLRTARLRGRRVRVTALARSVPAGTCAAGSSRLIRA